MRFIQVSIASLITVLMTLAGIHIAEADERRVELEINGALAFGDLVEPDGGAGDKGVLLITHGMLAH